MAFMSERFISELTDVFLNQLRSLWESPIISKAWANISFNTQKDILCLRYPRKLLRWGR